MSEHSINTAYVAMPLNGLCSAHVAQRLLYITCGYLHPRQLTFLISLYEKNESGKEQGKK